VQSGPVNKTPFKITCTAGNVSNEGMATVKMMAKKIAALKVFDALRNEQVSTQLAITFSNREQSYCYK